MIFSIPPLSAADIAVLTLIDAQKERLRIYTEHNPKRWFGSLRRSTFARAIRGSNSIEGYNASIDEAIAAIEGEPMDERTETQLAIRGYRDAMTYVIQASQDPYFEFGKQFLKSLHFMMVGFDMPNNPGQWRPGSIFVVNARSGATVYEGPDAELVDGLVEELVESIKPPAATHPTIRGAMAHLNLTMIHPFKDGNGRMARALQTLVLARGGTLSPVFSSIEEWLGANTEEYYSVLAETGQGTWNPGRDATAWVRFCLKGHYQQAATLIRRNEVYEKLYNGLQEITERLKLPERVNIPLFNAALGLRVTNSRYRTDTELSDFAASRDLKRLVDLDLLEPKGERRGRTYLAAPQLVQLRNSVRVQRPLEDPYQIVQRRSEAAQSEPTPRLPGL